MDVHTGSGREIGFWGIVESNTRVGLSRSVDFVLLHLFSKVQLAVFRLLVLINHRLGPWPSSHWVSHGSTTLCRLPFADCRFCFRRPCVSYSFIHLWFTSSLILSVMGIIFQIVRNLWYFLASVAAGFSWACWHVRFFGWWWPRVFSPRLVDMLHLLRLLIIRKIRIQRWY